jgi:hypothetical protein
MQAQERYPSWGGRACTSQDKASFIQTSVGVGIVFVVGRSSVDQNELRLLGDEAGIEKVKGPDLFD